MVVRLNMTPGVFSGRSLADVWGVFDCSLMRDGWKSGMNGKGIVRAPRVLGAFRKKIAVAVFSCVFSACPYALDLVGTAGGLSDVFSSFVDGNEGLTVFRSLNIPSGGRAESLGTACVALGDDSSFFDYNPAASCILERTEVSVCHNAWIADSAMETVSATARDGNLGYGAQLKCFYVPFTEYNLYGDSVSGSYYSETSAALNVSYNFRAGYNFRGIALGGSARAAWRDVPDYTDNKTDSVISGSGLEQSAAALMLDFGAIVRFNAAKFFSDRNPNLSLGFSVMNAGLSVTGFGSSLEVDDALPTRVAAGFSWRAAKTLLISAEFRQPVNLLSLSSSGLWSAAAGVELSVMERLSFDFGFLLQGANPRISFGGGFSVMRAVVNVNYTFDLTSSANPVNHISLSARMRFGDRGRAALREKVDSHYIAGVSLYASGRIEEAVLEWERALSLDPSFDPAREAREIAVRFLGVKDDIMGIQRFSVE